MVSTSVCNECVLNVSNYFTFKKKIVQAQDVLHSLAASNENSDSQTSNDDVLQIYELSDDEMIEEHLKFVDTNTPMEMEQVFLQNSNIQIVDSTVQKNQVIPNKNKSVEKRKIETNATKNHTQSKKAKTETSNDEKVTIQMNECLICPSILDDILQLNDHIALHKKILCKVCNRTFARYSNLKRHFNSVHSKPKPFQCDICGHGFSFSVNLQQHANLHYTGKIRAK